MEEGPLKIEFSRLRHDDLGFMLLDGKPFSGVAVDFWPNGSKATEARFRGGIQHGMMFGWHASGKKKLETPFEDGKVRGRHLEWHENGILIVEEIIGEEGILLEKREWDNEGKLVSEFVRS